LEGSAAAGGRERRASSSGTEWRNGRKSVAEPCESGAESSSAGPACRRLELGVVAVALVIPLTFLA
jgi:hypothetical protein